MRRGATRCSALSAPDAGATIDTARSAAVIGVRRRATKDALPPAEALSGLSDAEGPVAEHLDEANYRDDLTIRTTRGVD